MSKRFALKLWVAIEKRVMHRDNQGAIYLVLNSIYLERTKHIDIRYYFIQDGVIKGKAVLKKIAIAYNLANMMMNLIPFGEARAICVLN